MKKEYSKLGGWLIFFIVSCVLSLFLAIQSYSQNAEAMEILSTFGDGLSTISLLLKVSFFCIIIGTITGVVAVVIRKKKLLNIFFILTALSTLLAFVTMFLYPSYLSEVMDSQKSAMIIASVRDVVVLVIWFRYFKIGARQSVYFGEVEMTPTNEEVTTSEVE